MECSTQPLQDRQSPQDMHQDDAADLIPGSSSGGMHAVARGSLNQDHRPPSARDAYLPAVGPRGFAIGPSRGRRQLPQRSRSPPAARRKSRNDESTSYRFNGRPDLTMKVGHQMANFAAHARIAVVAVQRAGGTDDRRGHRAHGKERLDRMMSASMRSAGRERCGTPRSTTGKRPS
jgi:hypothetical protein